MNGDWTSIPISYSQVFMRGDNDKHGKGQFTRFPDNLYSWDRKDLEKLNIVVSYQLEQSPMQLFTKIQKTGLQMHKMLESGVEEKGIASLVKYVKQRRFIEILAKINYTSFDIKELSIKKSCVVAVCKVLVFFLSFHLRLIVHYIKL